MTEQKNNEIDLIEKYTIAEQFSNDIVRKVLFSHEDIFKSFLGNFDYFVKHFDEIETVEQEKDSFINITGSKRDSDCIWKVKFKNGKISFVWIIIEFQTKSQSHMAYRIAEYTFSLMQQLVKKYDKTDENFFKKGNKLPLIFPIVLFSGDGEWNAPLNIKDLYDIEVANNFNNHIFSLEYALIKEQEICQNPNKNDISELINKFFKLLSLRNIENMIPELEQIHSYLIDKKLEFLIRPVYFILLSLTRQTKSTNVSSNLKDYIIQNLDTGDTKMVQSQIQALRDSYDNVINNSILMGEQRGRQEGLLEGRQEGEQLLLSKLLTSFFKVDLTETQKDLIANANSQLLEKWGTNFMHCQSIQDVFKIK